MKSTPRVYSHSLVAGNPILLIMTTCVEKDPTVDPKEVAHYHRLAALWWDAEGPFWPLHRLNELRARWIVDQLAAELGLDPARQVAGHDAAHGLGHDLGTEVTGIQQLFEHSFHGTLDWPARARTNGGVALAE